jgi:hypothetical protein
MCMVPFAIVLFTFAPQLIGMFSSDPFIVDAAAGYLRWNSGVLCFLAVEAVTEGGFTGGAAVIYIYVRLVIVYRCTPRTTRVHAPNARYHPRDTASYTSVCSFYLTPHLDSFAHATSYHTTRCRSPLHLT